MAGFLLSQGAWKAVFVQYSQPFTFRGLKKNNKEITDQKLSQSRQIIDLKK